MERSSDEMVQGILDGMRWLGLTWDEGPEVGGPHAPYFQSLRLGRYRAVAAQLVASGHAYYDYRGADSRTRTTGPRDPAPDTRSQAESTADESPALFGPKSYDETSLTLGAVEVARREADGFPRAIRFRVPAEGRTTFADAVHGEIGFDNSGLEDFVILRSDGYPTYHLSVVVDDMDMRITQVIRGDDHISNTPEAGAAVPGAGRAGAWLRARAADHGARQEAAQQASRRDVGDGVLRAGHRARGDGELPRAARVVAGRRPGAVLDRRPRRALRSRRHQRRQRRVQHREARVDEQPAHHAAAR